MSVDPLAQKFPYVTPYAFAENDPIRAIDLEGLEKYIVTQRNFIPEKTLFGIFFLGDERGFSLKQNVTSRINHTFVINAYQNKITDPQKWSNDTKFQYCPDGNCVTMEKEAKPKYRYMNYNSGNQNGDQWFNFKSKIYASDPLAPGAPNINYQGQYSIEKKKNALFIDAKVRGDVFPATESFITDEAGNSVFIGVRGYSGSIFKAYGDNNESLIDADIRIDLDEDGNFSNKVYDFDSDRTYDRSEWNKKHSDQKAD